MYFRSPGKSTQKGIERRIKDGKEKKGEREREGEGERKTKTAINSVGRQTDERQRGKERDKEIMTKEDRQEQLKRQDGGKER